MSSRGNSGRALAEHSRSYRATAIKSESPRWDKDYETVQGKYISDFAHDHGMTRSEYQQAVTARMRDLLVNTQVYTRRSDRSAALIAQEGRFKTVHETGTSGGDTNDAARAQLETMLFGQKGTIYGYAATPASAKAANGQYGNVIFQVKPETTRQATITFNDTLNASGYNYTHDAYHFNEAVMPSPLASPDYRTWDYRSQGDPLQHLSSSSRVGLYTEVQFAHGLNLSDIAHVYFENEPTSQTADALRAAGVPFSTIPWYTKTLG